MTTSPAETLIPPEPKMPDPNVAGVTLITLPVQYPGTGVGVDKTGHPDGGVGGGAHAPVDAVSVARAERFPAASSASTANTYVVPHTRPANV
jgi:hypothetical protein